MPAEPQPHAPYAPLACVILAVTVGMIALVPRNNPAPPASVSADTVLRVYGVDLMWPTGVPHNALTQPPWTVGVPDRAESVVTKSVQARPAGAFGEAERDGVWRRWGVTETAQVDAAEFVDVRFQDELRHARVSVLDGEGVERPCDAWMFGRWFCGPEAWNFVGVASVVVRDRPTECIWAHPTAEGTLRIAFDDVPLGRVLVATTYLSDAAASSGNDGQVRWSATVDGVSVVDRVQRYRRGGMAARIDVPDALRDADPERELPTTVDVAFDISAESVAQQHFCFVATLRGVVEEAE